MINIHAHKKDLKRAVEMIKAMLDVDAAIFDIDSTLLAATDEYSRQKGHRVHAPSIQEVLANGNVVVNKPGHMSSCNGCRFIGNCPAKIEILKRFSTGSTPIGVMTLTSFTRQGHEKIVSDTTVYVQALNLFSDWIADLIEGRDKAQAFAESQETLNTLMDLSQDAVLTIDTRGLVTRGNARALKLFAFCDLYTRSAFNILPQPLVEKTLEASPIKGAKIRVNTLEFFLSARPVNTQGSFSGAVITLASTRKINAAPPLPQSPRNNTPGLDNILGSSSAIIQIKKMGVQLSKSNSTLLITGETGTGKGLLAKAIHYSGNRKDHPFIPVNCASIPDTLFESELFGYEEGAFTGAKKGGKPGKFELAHQGTLFLDEIGEMPLHLQAKLLNVLQDNCLQRIGGVDFLPVDLRVIAASNQDLEAMVHDKTFRSDLFYRLNVIPLVLPPLCLRKKDIPVLARAFVKTANIRANKSIKSISPKVLNLFSDHDWPGNIRELQNLIEYSVNMAKTQTICPHDLPERFLNHTRKVGPKALERKETHPNFRQRASMAQAQAIMENLDHFGHDVKGKTQTAKNLGISLRTLYRKLATMETDS
ncbi:MAG: sigma 54-interacting transcriptional regulator [Desulfobacter sp.]|nr:sigma 54-interacting transcriptional regulator [Desulfobacter sp.]